MILFKPGVEMFSRQNLKARQASSVVVPGTGIKDIIVVYILMRAVQLLVGAGPGDH